MGGKKAAIVFGVMGLLCALLSGWVVVSDHRQIAEARSWPSTPALIVGSWVDVQRGGGRNHSTRYTPKLNYTYSVGGRSYTNHYIWLTTTKSFSSRNRAATFLRDYPRGATVPVFYNPADPQRSALLIQSGAAPMYALLAVGLVLVGVGIWLFRRES
ncbi:MAG TPA: DUF3592 domain-containing protein [Allosphingosinicella sp.]|nr:DUF3592 domain-containing protein [Allosphingosinicella sp.]